MWEITECPKIKKKLDTAMTVGHLSPECHLQLWPEP